LALEGGGWSKPFPGHFSPWEKALVPIVQKAGCAPGSDWMAAETRKSLGPLEFKTQTIHPVASHYTKLSCPQNTIIIEFNFQYHGSHSNHTAARSVFAVLFHVSPGANITLMELQQGI